MMRFSGALEAVDWGLFKDGLGRDCRVAAVAGLGFWPGVAAVPSCESGVVLAAVEMLRCV